MSALTQRLLAGRREKVGEMMRGRREALNPILVALQEDHFNRRTADVIRRAGVEIQSIDRWLLGFFNLIVGRAPG